MKVLVAMIFGIVVGLYLGASFPGELHDAISPILSLFPHT
jgi:Na+/H+-dicarboxylate symporter